ncbi:ABC transporter substrate-binding protein [Selenihalanaerobacter shriftii]|uniref:Putative spermidine/putrescine transport system substrate-binding protein n=1 Tax=Selenihalanaerobacter shriftii TaxID=142842 RepID=A0A1T4K5H0_9FIRM|nr:ABC transporter substrate-binding protein [Selenihalanaerobacter shriftii]SJZ37577.1 putative spermidine/putrescine transport system substrate-binding protein [Selenihalanaerobacter shriftii]
MFNEKRLFIIVLAIIIISLFISGCAGPQQTEDEQNNVLQKEWDEIVKSAEGTKVNFYMWGGDRRINQWVDTSVASYLKEEYDIELNRVPMGANDYLNKLLGEKQVGRKEGSIDLLWINGENFKTAKEQDLLFGPFAEKLPNYNRYMDKESPETTTDFGFPTKGYEVPYGKAQFVFIYNKDKVSKPPKSYDELITWIKEHPGKFTYPALPDFTGSAFVRHVIYNETGGYKQYYDISKEKLREKIRPALEFLADLEPYLWREGKTYPATIAQVDNMYADGELWMTMGYNPVKASGEVEKGNFPSSTRTFILKEGTISNTHFLAIPFNAPNKTGALVAANFLESFDVQLSKLKPANWGDLPAFSSDKLSEAEKEEIKELDLGVATLPQKRLQEHRVPEIPADLVPIIEDEWKKIVGQ